MRDQDQDDQKSILLLALIFAAGGPTKTSLASFSSVLRWRWYAGCRVGMLSAVAGGAGSWRARGEGSML